MIAPPSSPSRPHAPHVERFVSASELGEYAYCRRAWWLRAVRGVTSEVQGERFAAGHSAHERHAWGLRVARLLVLIAIVALAVATAVLLLRGVGR